MLSLKWLRCGQDGHWCSFDNLNLATVDEVGVYVIWYSGNPSRVVYVGQGDVAARLADHRSNDKILAYRKMGRLLVTWAAVPAAHRDGVERYLANQWGPLVGDAHPDVHPIAVNSPW